MFGLDLCLGGVRQGFGWVFDLGGFAYLVVFTGFWLNLGFWFWDGVLGWIEYLVFRSLDSVLCWRHLICGVCCVGL